MSWLLAEAAQQICAAAQEASGQALLEVGAMRSTLHVLTASLPQLHSTACDSSVQTAPETVTAGVSTEAAAAAAALISQPAAVCMPVSPMPRHMHTSCRVCTRLRSN